MADRILILGASARAAAGSARRAGREPFCIDLFADADTQRLAKCIRCPIDDYPEGLFRLAHTLPKMPWMYTGGLENYPELIADLAQERELWGNNADAVKRVRDPFQLESFCRRNEILYPDQLPAYSPIPEGQAWLVKPYHGSAGHGIQHATTQSTLTHITSHYLQQYVSGVPMSAVFIDGRIQGMTHQLIGLPWLHAKPFHYCGNISVESTTHEALQDVLHIGQRLYDECRLQFIYNIDFILSNDHAVLIEVNPRYPASVEVLEYAQHRSLTDAPSDSATIVGKAIYFAPHRILIPESGPWDDSLDHTADVRQRPDYADIPHPGDIIEPGQPVLTFFAEAESESDCLRKLQYRARELDQFFGVIPR